MQTFRAMTARKKSTPAHGLRLCQNTPAGLSWVSGAVVITREDYFGNLGENGCWRVAVSSKRGEEVSRWLYRTIWEPTVRE